MSASLIIVARVLELGILEMAEFTLGIQILLANYAATGLRAANADVLVLAKGTSETQLLNLTMLIAAAVKTFCRWVFDSPI